MQEQVQHALIDPVVFRLHHLGKKRNRFHGRIPLFIVAEQRLESLPAPRKVAVHVAAAQLPDEDPKKVTPEVEVWHRLDQRTSASKGNVGDGLPSLAPPHVRRRRMPGQSLDIALVSGHQSLFVCPQRLHFLRQLLPSSFFRRRPYPIAWNDVLVDRHLGDDAKLLDGDNGRFPNPRQGLERGGMLLRILVQLRGNLGELLLGFPDLFPLGYLGRFWSSGLGLLVDALLVILALQPVGVAGYRVGVVMDLPCPLGGLHGELASSIVAVLLCLPLLALSRFRFVALLEVPSRSTFEELLLNLGVVGSRVGSVVTGRRDPSPLRRTGGHDVSRQAGGERCSRLLWFLGFVLFLSASQLDFFWRAQGQTPWAPPKSWVIECLSLASTSLSAPPTQKKIWVKCFIGRELQQKVVQPSTAKQPCVADRGTSLATLLSFATVLGGIRAGRQLPGIRLSHNANWQTGKPPPPPPSSSSVGSLSRSRAHDTIDANSVIPSTTNDSGEDPATGQ